MALPCANGGASRALGLKVLRVQGKGGEPTSRVGQAGRPGSTSAQFGRPFAPVGPHAFMHLSPSTCMILTMSSFKDRYGEPERGGVNGSR
jgi:hypothetical protein